MTSLKDILRPSIPIYDSARRPHPLVEELLALFRYRELVRQFISRAIKTRYKRSFLGVLWTMLNPLMSMLVLTLVFSGLFRSFGIEHYPVYVLSGLVVWIFFSSTTSLAMGDMIWSGNLLSRIYVPKSVFAVSSVGTGLVNLSISLVLLLGISIVLGVPLRPALLVLPLSTLLLAMFALGMGLLLSTAAVYFGDMVPVYEVLLTVWMYASPIIYTIDIIPARLLPLFKLNPLYYLLLLFREPLFEGVVPQLSVWLIAAGFSLAALILGGFIFTAKANEYAYRI